MVADVVGWSTQAKSGETSNNADFGECSNAASVSMYSRIRLFKTRRPQQYAFLENTCFSNVYFCGSSATRLLIFLLPGLLPVSVLRIKRCRFPQDSE